MELIASMDQCITCLVSQDSQRFFLSTVYGSNEGVDRRRLWSHLSSMKNSICQNPWLLVGDFNVIAHPSKDSRFTGSQVMNLNNKEFKECMQTLAVFDHAFTGPLLTWSNHQEEAFLARKLDRVFD